MCMIDFFMRPFKNADVMTAHCDGACNRTGARLVMAVKKTCLTVVEQCLL